MYYVGLRERDLEDAKTFIASLKADFLPARKARKRNSLERYLTNPDLRMILAKDNGAIVGYVAYKFNVKGAGRIIGIGVAKRYRRRGIGKTLFKKALADLSRKHSRIIARTWSTNIKARSLNEKMGFKKYRTVKDTRLDGSDDLWYSWIRKKN